MDRVPDLPTPSRASSAGRSRRAASPAPLVAGALAALCVASGLWAAAAARAPASSRAAEASAAGSVGVRKVQIGSFSSPVLITSPPGDRRRMFVVEKEGRVRVIQDGRKLQRPFLDISGRVASDGERGLLSLAFSPSYATSRRLYVYFTDNAGDIHVQELKRSTESVNRVDYTSRRNVLTVSHRTFSNHNGGHLVFGNGDRLYISIGDGGGAGDPFRAGQNVNTLLGKLLRIDPRRSGARPYRVPTDNPYVGRPGRDEIYARGLRNPWRFSLDRTTWDLTLADVGQNLREEVNFLPLGQARGANFGWSCYEGSAPFYGCHAPGHVPPVHEYLHTGGRCSVTGGYVLHRTALPGLEGRYVYGDFCTGELRSVVLRRPRATDDRAVGVTVPSLTSFGRDSQGRLYAVSLEGPVYRLAPR